LVTSENRTSSSKYSNLALVRLHAERPLTWAPHMGPSGPGGSAQQGVDQVDQQRQHGHQRAQNNVAHAIVVGIVRHPPRPPAAHRDGAAVSVLLGAVQRRATPPRRRAGRSAGASGEPLLFLLFLLQFPPNSRGLRLAETGVSFWEQALTNRRYEYIQKHGRPTGTRPDRHSEERDREARPQTTTR